MTTSGRVLLAATSAMAMLVLDSSIIGIMLPSMTIDLGLTSVEQIWTVTAYLLTLAVLLPIGGRLVDRVGPARGSRRAWQVSPVHRWRSDSRRDPTN